MVLTVRRTQPSQNNERIFFAKPSIKSLLIESLNSKSTIDYNNVTLTLFPYTNLVHGKQRKFLNQLYFDERTCYLLMTEMFALCIIQYRGCLNQFK